jgi:hypothetical protein
MKLFRKNDQNFFVCEECGRLCKSRSGLGNHISKNHNLKEYYDKWLKEENEGLCKICGKSTEFISIQYQYKNCCSKECSLKYGGIREKEECIKKYGIENVFQLESIKNKNKETNFKKYGVKYPSQSKEIREKSKQSWIKNLGVDHPSKSIKIKKRKIETCLANYGVKYPMQSNNIRRKSKITCFKKYGVENISQNENIKIKKEITSLKNNKGKNFYKKSFNNSNLYYQGSYELDFLEKYYNKYSDIQRGPTIKYLFEEKKLFYYPDFLIPSLNLIIECKNSYLFKKDKEKIKAKEKATISNGFKYIIIIDKNYNNLESLLLKI